MTARSERRKAELEVIEAARRWRNATPWEQKAVAADLLQQAVDALDLLGAAPVGKTYVSRNAPETSTEAAQWIDSKVNDLVGQVFVAIAAAWHNNAIGLTTDQLQQKLSGTHQSISPRVTDLRDSGWIRDSGIRRQTRSGRWAVVWTPTTIGMDGFRTYLRGSWDA